MKTLLLDLKRSLLALFGLCVILCVLYPLLIWGVAQIAFKDQANGSLLKNGHKLVGSRLIGQTFTAPQYFHGRPSAAGKGYDAANSGGSNLGPTSAKLLDGIADDRATKDDEAFAGLAQRVAAYRETNHLAADVKIPVDAVTASASGLDPHISIANAALQMPRVARERNMDPELLRKLMRQATDGRDFGIFGEPGVNVLKLNLALDGNSAASH